MAITIVMARMRVSALESWWRTTKLALESGRSKSARIRCVLRREVIIIR